MTIGRGDSQMRMKRTIIYVSIAAIACLALIRFAYAQSPLKPGASHAEKTVRSLPDDSSRDSATNAAIAPPAKEPRRHSIFSLSVSELYLQLDVEYEQRRVHAFRKPDELVQENRDLQIEETLGTRFDGFIYDPVLFSYAGEIELGLSQSQYWEEYGSRSDSEWSTGSLMNFDLSFDVLRDKPVSLYGYARNLDRHVSRRFLPSLEEDETEFGLSAVYRNDRLSTEFGFAYRDVDREGNRDALDDESFRMARFFANAEWRIGKRQILRFAYDHEDEHTSYQGSDFTFDTQRDRFRLEHELMFGDKDRHRLMTFLRYDDERGDFARDELELASRLSLKHSEVFRTSYRYSFYRYTQDSIEVAQHKGDIEATYRPIDNLSITGNAYILREEIDADVDTDEYGGGLDVSYSTKTGAGELFANAALAYDRRHSTGTDGRLIVRNEAHTMSSVRINTLRQFPVDLGSVLAHNVTRSRYYVNGVDYLLSYTRGRASVRRLPTGRIAEGEVVYFDYTYGVYAGSTVEDLRASVLVEHRFENAITPYYAFESRFQDVETRSVGRPLFRDNMDRHRFGVRYDEDRWSLSGELEIFDDSIEPYDAAHLHGRYALARDRHHTLDLSADLSRYWFEGGLDDRNVWWFDVDLSDRLTISPTFWIDTTLGYRFEDDSIAGNTNGVDLASTLGYSRNYFNLELTVEYDLLYLPDSRENGLGVFLNVRRDISHILPNFGEDS